MCLVDRTFLLFTHFFVPDRIEVYYSHRDSDHDLIVRLNEWVHYYWLIKLHGNKDGPIPSTLEDVCLGSDCFG